MSRRFLCPLRSPIERVLHERTHALMPASKPATCRATHRASHRAGQMCEDGFKNASCEDVKMFSPSSSYVHAQMAIETSLYLRIEKYLHIFTSKS